MMRLCACGQWAQFKLTYPDKTIRFVCAADKDAELAAIPEVEQPKVQFVGAVPHGTDRP